MAGGKLLPNRDENDDGRRAGGVLPALQGQGPFADAQDKLAPAQENGRRGGGCAANTG